MIEEELLLHCISYYMLKTEEHRSSKIADKNVPIT